MYYMQDTHIVSPCAIMELWWVLLDGLLAHRRQ